MVTVVFFSTGSIVYYLYVKNMSVMKKPYKVPEAVRFWEKKESPSIKVRALSKDNHKTKITTDLPIGAVNVP